MVASMNPQSLKMHPVPIENRELIDKTLRFVVERTWRVGDTDFFYDLVKFLGEVLGVAYVFCDVVDPADNTMVETVALYSHGEVTENIRYSLKNTPCENVIGRSVCCYAEGIQQLFPEDHLLVDMGAESYAGIPIWSADGEPLGLIAIIDDQPIETPELIVTVLQIVSVRAGGELERMQAEETLRVSEESRQLAEERLRNAITIMSDGFALYDRDGRLEFFNDSFQEIHRYQESELVPGVTTYDSLGELDRERSQNTRQPLTFEERLSVLRRDGPSEIVHQMEDRTFERHQSATPEGGIISLITDITKLKSAEELSTQARQDAEKANAAKSEFLASMSHELRTPLNAIIGFSEMLKNNVFGTLGDVRNQEYIEDINAAGDHLLSLINNILDLSKIEAGKEETIVKETDIHPVVLDCVEMLKVLANDKRIQIRCNLPNFFPTIRVDHRHLTQVLINLLSNAVKFTPEGGAIEITSTVEENRWITIRISDTGIGISADEIPKVLQEFVRGGDVMTRTQIGTGLGLPLAKRLVELNGGSISIDSELGVGTTVTVQFPK